MNARTLIHALGGTTKVAADIGSTRDAVRAWYRLGIPYRHWRAIKDLAASQGIVGVDDAALDLMRPQQRVAA